MYHSIYFGTKNCYSDYHLIPSSRPVINPPEKKSNYIDIPGGNGSLDLSEALTGYPLFNNREGELEFYVENGHSWTDIYSKLLNEVHGKYMDIILEDSQEWVYKGRLFVDEWESPTDGTWSVVTMKYIIEPYAVHRYINHKYGPYALVAEKSVSPLLISSYQMPVSPTFTISGLAKDQHITFEFTNKEIKTKDSVTSKTVCYSNGTHKFPEIVVTNFSGTNTCLLKMTATGAATVSIEHKTGRL